jgi:diaminohydroxyphosphoribosylaminopyrimidine deaminase/5-amino-6-(5-phosphoribosylamino)uracil reductase
MYVTLEPCNHHGRTPPCVDAILEAGIARVVIGAVDPDSRVAGSGARRLADGGIEVEVETDEPAAVGVDPGYFRQRRTGLPRVIIKYAMTLDGAVAAIDRSSKWITGEEARADAHRLRAAMDAVMIGAGTLRADDPLLDSRLEGTTHQPVPVILAGSAELPDSAAIWARHPVVIAARSIDVPTGEVIVVDDDGSGLPEPESAARALADRGLYDILLEGGSRVAGAWWRAGVISGGVAYVAGKIGGGAGVSPLGGIFESISSAEPVRITGVQKLGEDLRIEFS